MGVTVTYPSREQPHVGIRVVVDRRLCQPTRDIGAVARRLELEVQVGRAALARDDNASHGADRSRRVVHVQRDVGSGQRRPIAEPATRPIDQLRKVPRNALEPVGRQRRLRVPGRGTLGIDRNARDRRVEQHRAGQRRADRAGHREQGAGVFPVVDSRHDQVRLLARRIEGGCSQHHGGRRCRRNPGDVRVCRIAQHAHAAPGEAHAAAARVGRGRCEPYMVAGAAQRIVQRAYPWRLVAVVVGEQDLQRAAAADCRRFGRALFKRSRAARRGRRRRRGRCGQRNAQRDGKRDAGSAAVAERRPGVAWLAKAGHFFHCQQARATPAPRCSHARRASGSCGAARTPGRPSPCRCARRSLRRAAGRSAGVRAIAPRQAVRRRACTGPIPRAHHLRCYTTGFPARLSQRSECGRT